MMNGGVNFGRSIVRSMSRQQIDVHEVSPTESICNPLGLSEPFSIAKKTRSSGVQSNFQYE